MIKLSKRIYVYFVLYSIMLFMAGGFFGQILIHHRPQGPRHPFLPGRHFPAPQREPEAADIIRHIERELKLNPEQQKQVRAIITQSQPAFQAEIEKIRRDLDEIKQKIDAEIEAVLNPEQIKIFRDHTKRPSPPPHRGPRHEPGRPPEHRR